MDKSTAAARLGLSSAADPKSITRAYGEQLGKLQQQLVAAHTDQERHESQIQLAELIEAYECLSGSGRYSGSRSDDETQARPAGDRVTEVQAREAVIRLETGAVLSDRLEVGPMLGQGGMGYVFAARDRLKNENVAIKVLRQDLMFSTAAKERFLAEAKVSCNFSHPNIVNVYDVGVSGGNYYFSMELLKGQTLRSHMEKYHRDRRLFSVAEINEITRQLVDALRYAHRHIVHRDIKPENIWLEHDGTVKLMDFGIARANANSDMTQTGMTLGTAYYMAPEQRVAAKEVDWRADLYSLGIVLYELMAGAVPMGAARPLEQLRRDLPKRYARAVMRAIATRPEDRWPSLQAFFSELSVRQRKTSWMAAAALVGVVGAVAAGAGLYIYENRNVDPQLVQQPRSQTGDNKAGNPGADSATSALNKPGLDEPGLDEPGLDSPGDPPANDGNTQGPTTGGSSRNSNSGTAAKQIVTPGTDGQVSADGTSSNAGTSSSGSGNAQVAAQLPLPPADVKPAVKPATRKPTTAADTMPLINTPAPRGPTPEQLDALSNSNDQFAQCKSECARDESKCYSINRNGRSECARAAAFGGAASSNSRDCGPAGIDSCQYASDREACLRNLVRRRGDCSSGGSMIKQRQDCDRAARDADQRCLVQKQECMVACR
jgi:serine/threonine protein kinase